MLRNASKRILVIDDVADRQHECDVLLDQNFYADMDTRYTGKVPAHCKLLLGPRDALLREEFRSVREQAKPRIGPVKRILVFFGGVDHGNYTSRSIEALANIRNSDLHVDVVIGALHSHREEIEKACAENSFICHVQTDRMAELMVAADLAIGAGGSATWERCSVGLPTIVLVLADNQRKAAEDLDAAEALVNLGDANKVTTEELTRKVVGLMADEKKRSELSRVSLELVRISNHKGVADFMVD